MFQVIPGEFAASACAISSAQFRLHNTVFCKSYRYAEKAEEARLKESSHWQVDLDWLTGRVMVGRAHLQACRAHPGQVYPHQDIHQDVLTQKKICQTIRTSKVPKPV
jgi:hypothetical protein